MVVVDGVRRAINKTVDISVTSVHQTTAGKMIFGRYEDRSESARHAVSSSPAAEPGPRPVADASAVERQPRSIVPDPTHS
jgi:hypothetical protein